VTERIYIIQSKANGKKNIFVRATTEEQARRVLMEQFFTTSVASHAELFEAFKYQETEILDAVASPQDDIDEKIEESKEQKT
jgi:hypothetical protein